ncbi:hypothetical protein TSUD_143590 [Trifolium subterraneum]|uniref:Acetyltransferase n=1 Tax=Trifolium subterraneum TaxID=3900 RepID=A0A2Z6NU08_TRISU|nr:hypothetical protein TSUD_143590 [Trifolium subterraneum]
MGVVRILSSDAVKASKSCNHTIDLTPWDLQFLTATPNKKGLLFHHQKVANQIQRLRHSLSSSLASFQPLAGCLEITEHEDNVASCSIKCNNVGALFIHAAAENTYVADIDGPTYVPSIVDSFFAYNGVRNYEGTSQPLLAVQVTELVDGIFVGCTFNHVAVDGNSMWHFINSWAEISRGSCDQISKPPILEHWFPNGIKRPIQFPFTMEPQNNPSDTLSFSSFDEEKLCLSERLFHFKKEKIMKLKSKVNAEIGSSSSSSSNNKISSLQALLTHLWCSVIRSKKIDPKEEVHLIFMIGVRPRFVPSLLEDYFGNAIIGCGIKMKVGELLKEGGQCKGALEMNKLIASHSNEMLKKHYESWLKNPMEKSLGLNDSSCILHFGQLAFGKVHAKFGLYDGWI